MEDALRRLFLDILRWKSERGVMAKPWPPCFITASVRPTVKECAMPMPQPWQRRVEITPVIGFHDGFGYFVFFQTPAKTGCEKSHLMALYRFLSHPIAPYRSLFFSQPHRFTRPD
jgi:hypothetical protein